MDTNSILGAFDIKNQVDPTKAGVRIIVQTINKRNGVRSPAIMCSPVEFVLTAEKVYGVHTDLEGNALPDPDLRPLNQYLVLVVAATDPTDTAVIDRRGVSTFPLMSLDRFCHMIKYPNQEFVPDV